MKIKFLQRSPENTRLIVIICGWSAGPEVVGEIKIKGWDVAVVYDFTELHIDCDFLNSYYTVYLYAWSLGVFAASRLLPADRITCGFAINGTLTPIDDKEGIRRAVYEGTMKELNQTNLRKFRLRMSGDRKRILKLEAGGPSDIDNLKIQLYAIQQLYTNAERTGCKNLPWIRAFISKDDKIFLPCNQKRAWEKEEDVDIVELPGHHFPDFKEIIRMTIADPEAVGRRFQKASATYDTHAIAQYSSAIQLTAMLGRRAVKERPDVLEIGCGTGLFTREYSRIIHPGSATFVDITPTGPFNIAQTEEYFVEDAEKWIEREERSWDLIVSASSIQWFADIPRFLHLCNQRLKEGGIIALSTFLPGNMAELDAFRPAPLLYPKSADLRNWLERDFEEVEVKEDEIRVEFKTVREMLMHLKHTGVGGSAPDSGLSLKDMTHLRSLTYRPVYAIGKKRNRIN